MNSSESVFAKPFDYTPVENNTNGAGIRIDSGEFAGLVVKLSKINFEEVNDECVLHFDYDVFGEFDDTRRDELEGKIGDLVLHVLSESIKNGELGTLVGA